MNDLKSLAPGDPEAYPFADLDLARRLEGAEAHGNARFVEARARCFPESGAEWIAVGGAHALFDGVDSPATQTFGLGLHEPVTEAVLEQVEAFFARRGAPVFHEVSPLAGVALAALLHERGYCPVELSSVLYRPVRGGIGRDTPGDGRMRVRPIRPGEEAAWVETAAQGWGEVPGAADFLRNFGAVNTHREGAVCFLAEYDGAPIASATLCIGPGGVAQMAGASTVPEGRRRGAQLALLDARLRHAAERGCDVIMIATEPGSASQRNAERHGFRIAYTRTKWHRTRP